MNVAPLYRTFWRRLWAGYVDALVFAPLMVLDAWIQHQWLPRPRAVWFACYAAMVPAYQIYMHGRCGQTIGKRLLRVKVVDLSGSPLTMGQAFRRELINLPLAIWWNVAAIIVILQGGDPYEVRAAVKHSPLINLQFALFALELASTLVSSKRRALHDLIAGSVVVRLSASKETETDVPAVLREPNAGEFACTACGNPVRFGASHCHACEQPFVYRDGHPKALP